MYPNKVNPVYGIYVHDQVRALKELGCEVRVVSPISLAPFPLTVMSRRWKSYSLIGKQAEIDGIQVSYPRVLNLPGGRMLDKIGIVWERMLRETVRAIAKDFKFDIILSHVALPDGQAGILLGQEFGTPVITFIHGADFLVTIHRSEKYRRAVAKVVRGSDHVVAVSNKLKATGLELAGDQSRISVVLNGISLDKVFAGVSPLQDKYKNVKVLLAVGNLKKTKGFDFAIAALARLAVLHPQVRLLIIGSGPEESSLKSQVKSLNLGNQVEFLGRLEHREVMEYMSVADIFVLPSWREGFGAVYIEAMAHGVPVIGCQGQGIADVIRHGYNGILVPPKDVDALEIALSSLLADENLRTVLGRRGQALVQSELTWEKNAERVLAICRELTG